VVSEIDKLIFKVAKTVKLLCQATYSKILLTNLYDEKKLSLLNSEFSRNKGVGIS
jgi:hypothetical protein